MKLSMKLSLKLSMKLENIHYFYSYKGAKGIVVNQTCHTENLGSK